MIYDAIVIGAGPAGMTATIYLKRANKKVLLIEKNSIGGQIATSPIVENYPGYSKISGTELVDNMFEQVDNLGVDFELEEVIDINEKGKLKEVITDSNAYKARTVIIASGLKYRTLSLPNEDKLIGNGIHFCVACDGAFYKNKKVIIVGGGNSAAVNAITMSEIAKEVVMVQNLSELTCEEKLKEKIESLDNIKIITDSVIKEYLCNKRLTGVVIDHKGKEETILTDGLFLCIGLTPANNFVKDLIKMDKFGYINSDDCTTNVDGIYVAGDARTKKFHQVTLATGDGTEAALLAINYLND